MKYYVPNGEYEYDESILNNFQPPMPASDPQKSLMDKIGGRVWGLPLEKYPSCPECETPFTFVAQFTHHPERLDLGRDGRVLFVFDCFNKETYCASDGADERWDNTSLILEPEELTNELTPLPEPKNVLKTGERIENWIVKEDNVSAEHYIKILEGENQLDFLPEGEELNFTNQTRLGSAPYFLQYSPDWVRESLENSATGWKFAAQFDSYDSVFEIDALKEPLWGGGIGYVFIRPTKDNSGIPECKFFFQCT